MNENPIISAKNHIGVRPSELFSKAHVAEMLLFISSCDKVKENDLTQVCKNYYTAVNVASILVEMSLVIRQIDTIGRTTTYYSVTDLGREVATDLKRADDRMRGIVGVGNQTDCGASSDPMDPVTHSTGDT